MSADDSNSKDIEVRFSHIQIYADELLGIDEYKQFEADTTSIHEEECFDRADASAGSPTSRDRQTWDVTPPKFVSSRRDVVKQLIAAFGFRVTGCYPGTGSAPSCTNSVLVTSSDPRGIQVLVTAQDANAQRDSEEKYLHFGSENIETFFRSHSNRQGVAVLSFEVVGRGDLDVLYQRYLSMHPGLLPDEYKMGPMLYANEGAVLEVYAYYQGDRGSGADHGTRLRFIEPSCHDRSRTCILPGMVQVPAEFQAASQAAYFDHWVSNVVSRTGFVDTLEDVLGFVPKVDFNAGVVAAGEAQIESTVTGNSSDLQLRGRSEALRDQSQIYLPINNALTNVGHVHGFLKELGQGVQHIASRVGDIVSFVQQANNRREIFGEGFTFLNIPRSYYGVLTEDMLVKGIACNGNNRPDVLLTAECAGAAFEACRSSGLLNDDSSVDLDATADSIRETLRERIPRPHQDELHLNLDAVIETILRSRYVNLLKLLGDHLSKNSYVSIVKNRILVDVQGQDLLFQIFTSNILQRGPGEESPFFEFIQRVCSECRGPDGCPRKIKPGCGGFGIRNFLTLFLSIEVTNAMLEASSAKDRGDESSYLYAKRRVEIFTEQLNESNPLLTEISNCMTREGLARDRVETLGEEKDDEYEIYLADMKTAAEAKERANGELFQCNMKYQRLMRELRERNEM